MKSIHFVSLALAATVFVATGAQAKNGFKVLHSFAGGPNDGANPYGGVVPDPIQLPPSGYYVATDAGGADNLGTLTFISAKKGAATVVHSFTGGADGENADGAPAISLSDYVVGTTRYGGADGCGTAYRYTIRGGAFTNASFSCYGGPPPNNLAFPFSGPTIDPGTALPIGTAPLGGQTNNGGWYLYDYNQGQIGRQYEFSGSDGSAPYGGITEVQFAGGDTAWYVPASAGGSSNLGTVTVFDSSGTRVLHNFTGGSDGANPYGKVLNEFYYLFGTTYYGGGTNLGTVYRMDISGGSYSVLHTFQGICCGNSDGSFPSSGLTPNWKDGMYYGTTINGGGPTDNGTVYKIDPNTGAETVVHAFTGPDGAHPTYGDLYIDSKGTIYGTTLRGGKHNLGVVFRLKT